MCLFKSKKNEREQALELLRKYVTEAEPTLNKQLRCGCAATNQVALFDSLFSHNSLPRHLYRWLPFQENITQDNFLCDKAYLSCSKDCDLFINHVVGDNVTCYKIITDENLKSIDISALIPEGNDEGEYLLPRDLKFHIVCDKTYQSTEFSQFIKDIHSEDLRDSELIDVCHINSIKLLVLEPIITQDCESLL